MASIIAICISIEAIFSQNKAAVFDKRLDVYLQTDKILNRARKIIKFNEVHRTPTKEFIASTLLDTKGQAYQLAKKVLVEEKLLNDCEKENKDYAAFDEAVIDYYK